MFGLGIVDLIAIFAYLIGITLLGVWMGRARDSQDYFVGGRRFGKLISIFSVFGAGTHSDQAVSVVSKTYTSGMSGIWYQWLYLFVTPFNWWIAPILRRCRAITTADYFEARYDRGVASLYVVLGLLYMIISIGVLLKGAGAVVQATSGGQVSQGWIIGIMTVMFVIYNVVGGLSATMTTNFIQGCLTILFSFILLPFAFHVLGGFSGLHAHVAESVQRMHAVNPTVSIPSVSGMWSLVAPGGITWFCLIVIALNGMLGLVVQPHAMPIAGAVKSEKEAQIGSVYGSLMKRVCTVAWTLLGMCAIALYPAVTNKDEMDQMFGRLAYDFLPNAMPGLLGIFIASLLASIMAACGALMLACSGLFTNNLYRTFIAPHASQGRYVNVGRLSGVLSVLAGVIYALTVKDVNKGVEQSWIVSAMTAIPFWVGLFWRRATAPAAWASVLVACAIWLATEQECFIRWAAIHADWLLADGKDKIYLPTQMVLYLGVGTFIMFVVSLFTRRPDSYKLDLFYDTLRTPIHPDEHIVESLRLPAGVKPAPQNKLINHPDWEIQIPTRRGIVGFFLAWIVVIAMIGLVMLLVRIGA